MKPVVPAGTDVNARDERGDAPLHAHWTRDQPRFDAAVVRRLLDLGGDPETLDQEGRTPMDHAVDSLWLQGMAEVRRLLRTRAKERGDAR